MTSSKTSIVWFRNDLRVHDNPALSAAASRGGPVIAIYVLDEETEELRPARRCVTLVASRFARKSHRRSRRVRHSPRSAARVGRDRA